MQCLGWNSPQHLHRFLGMMNQLGKFSAHLAELSQPLRELLSHKKAWLWGPVQDTAFRAIKEKLTKPTTLALYNVTAPTTVSASSSSSGLSAVLLQKCSSPPSGSWAPIAYASCATTPTEQRYSRIEKEALALVWACEKFSTFVIRKCIMLETDHKPLVPLMGLTNLDCLPPRVLHFRIRLMRFDYSISHVPSKSLHTADALSRAPISGPSDLHSREANQTESFVDNIVSSLPADPDHQLKYFDAQQKDDICSRVIAFCKKGWPKKEQMSRDMLPYWHVRGEHTLCRDLLLQGKCIVVPASFRTETLEKIHSGHQGIQQCLLRITSAVWWPQVKHEIERLVQNCPTCTKVSMPQCQPMIASELPTHPWEKVASDLFYLNGETYILVADYFSRYLEVQSMSSTTSCQTVQALKAIFSRHGIPATAPSMPQRRWSHLSVSTTLLT